MKQIQPKTAKRISHKSQHQETVEVLAHFFEESSKMIREARKTARKKYPELFTTSVK